MCERLRSLRCGSIVFSSTVMLVFLSQYFSYMEFRRDKFDEIKIGRVLGTRGVDTVVSHGVYDVLRVMPSLRTKSLVYYYGQGLKATGVPTLQRFAFLSASQRLDESLFRDFNLRVESSPELLNSGLGNWDEYRIIHREESGSDVGTEFCRKTKSGRNSLFFYVLEKDVTLTRAEGVNSD
jgi:hypothetical protein